jgi:hypothetical protein
MHTLTRHSRKRARIAWIACLAILFNALVPLVSHAMDAMSPAPAPIVMDLEVCTALGMQAMPLTLAPAGPAKQDGGDSGMLHKNMNHCAWCAAHASPHGLPPPISAALNPAAGRDAYPPLYYQASRPLFPWSLAQPRAPPQAA